MTYRPYRNSLMNELMVPRNPGTPRRLYGFFDAIGWDVRNNSKTDREVLASPDVGAFVAPTIAYWQTENWAKTSLFAHYNETQPSEYARGLRLPHLQELVEVVMIVPTDDHVHEIFDRGGKILEAHAHVLPREHAGVQEFRFSDPFNYSLRVAANPGYEVNPSSNPLAGRQIDHQEGTSYVVEEDVIRAEGWERTGQLSNELLYTQIVAGGYPAGTRYVRTEEEILHGTMPDDPEAPIFRIHED